MADKNFRGTTISIATASDWYTRLNNLRHAVGVGGNAPNSIYQNDHVRWNDMAILFSQLKDAQTSIINFEGRTNKRIGVVGDTLYNNGYISADTAAQIERDLSSLEGSCITHCPTFFSSHNSGNLVSSAGFDVFHVATSFTANNSGNFSKFCFHHANGSSGGGGSVFGGGHFSEHWAPNCPNNHFKNANFGAHNHLNAVQSCSVNYAGNESTDGCTYFLASFSTHRNPYKVEGVQVTYGD